ncbi:MAG: hypothetical protein ACF8PN_03715 [Phycisphaerales bacterium]
MRDPKSISPQGSAMESMSRAESMLLEFLRDHNAACPVCGGALSGLVEPVCPECRQRLVFAAGVRRLRLGWLFVAVAPGFFSGIAACFVLVPALVIFFGGGGVVWPLAAVILFGWLSAAVAILLATRKRRRFLALPAARRRGIALLIWLIHLMTLVVVIVALEPQI